MSSPRNSPCGPSPRRTDAARSRGSAIVSVLVLAAVTAVLVSGFLFRSSQEAKLATRSFFDTAALNLAEAGLEEGLHAANSSGFTSSNGWSLASGSSTDYVKTITTGLDFTQATGTIYVRVDSPTSSNPIVTATGVITIPNQPRILKQLRVGGTARRLWANAIVAKGVLTFGGSSDIDAYDSSAGPYDATLNRTDTAMIATDSTAVSPLNVTGSATIYGYVATGGSQPVVGGSGRIYGATTPSGVALDTSRVRTDFNMNLADATAPTTTSISLGSVTNNLTLPRAGDVAGANGRYLYAASSVELNSNKVLTINGPVDIICNADMTVNGSAKILLNSGSTVSLNLYCKYNITLNGGGMVNNTTSAANVTIWGTAASSGSQSIEINGSADFIGVLYAPNAALTLAGNSSVFGAMIAKTVTMNGNGGFHYDTRLSGLNTTVAGSSSSSSPTLSITSWCELTARPGSGDSFARDNRAPFNVLF